MSIRSLFLFTALLAGCSEYNFESKTDPISVPADSEVVADSDAIDTDLGDPLSSPAFVVDPPVLDFGYVEEGTFIEQDVEVTNVGDADGTLTDLMILGSTTFSWAADRQPFTLAPGERDVVRVRFTPDAAVSEGVLSFATDDPLLSTGEVLLTGTGENPALVASPSPLMFDTIHHALSVTLPLTLHNPGNAPVQVSNLSLGTPTFTIDTAALPLALAPGDSTEVDVTFMPDREGAFADTLVLTSDARLPAADVSLLGEAADLRPTALCEASPAQITTVGGTTTLVGRDSTDPRGQPLTHDWTLTSTPAASQVSLPVGGADRGPITPDLPGTYEVELVVTNTDGLSSEPCLTQFTYAEVRALTATPSPLTLPTTTLGASRSETLTVQNIGNADVTLTDLVPADAQLTAGTPAAAVLAPSDSTQISVTYTPDTPGALVTTLTVRSDAPDVVVPVISEAEALPPTADCTASPPVVSALGGVSTFIGTGSADPAGRPLTYRWTLTAAPAGSSVVLTGTGQTPDRGPIAPDRAGTYTAQLVVTNDLGLASAPCTASFEMAALPQLALTPDPVDFGEVVPGDTARRTVTVENVGNTTVTLTGASTSQAPFTVSGLAATMLQPGDTVPFYLHFAPTVLGTHQATLSTTSDAPDASAALTGRGEADAPTALCGASAATLVTDDDVMLYGSGSSDPQGSALSYDWAWLSQPPGASLSLNGSASTPNRGPLSPVIPGLYEAELVVTNALGVSSTPCQASFELLDVPAPPDDDCEGVSDLIYVVERDNEGLYLFDPSTQDLSFVATLDCDWIGRPESMSVGRDGHAYVRWSDDSVYDVDLDTGSCTLTDYSRGSFGSFGMGFATDFAGTWQDQMYVANEDQLARLDTTTWQLDVFGTMSSQAELTGNADGELWAFLPLEKRLQELSKSDGTVLDEQLLPTFPSAQSIDTFAFATWGGEFWLFVRTYGVAHTSDVYRVDASGNMTLVTTGLGIDIVGAGVSTCVATP